MEYEINENNSKCCCPKCGHDEFHVHEYIYWKGFVDEKDNLKINLRAKSTGIDLVECAECEADITEISLNPNFKFNFE